jgi:twitching motility protein PilT
MTIKQLLQYTVERNASDLHIIAGLPPTIRVDGELMVIPDQRLLTHEQIVAFLKEILVKEQFERLNVNKEIDVSLQHSEKARFRVNSYTQKRTFAIAFRTIPMVIPQIDSLGLPKIIHSFTTLKQGFILITGPTGHGKSTTLAAILDEINATRKEHIVTMEDPVEFVFSPQKSIISQRELGTDTHSWKVALRSVLREDPNVVLVGEMRDYETIASALTVAETGHLVFATLHTNSAAQTVDRIVDVFPEEQQDQVRMQLSGVLEAVFSMRLIPAVKGGRVVAYELMLGSTAIKTVVREGKTHQIDSIIQTSSEIGMNRLDTSLANLVKKGAISLETAQTWSLKPEELDRLVKK